MTRNPEATNRDKPMDAPISGKAHGRTESELLGDPLRAAPKRDPTDSDCMGRKKQKRDGAVVRDDDGNALFGGYCGNWPGKATDHVGEGRCALHGGATPDGTDHGAWRHGLYSDVIRPEDRDTLATIQRMSTEAKLEATLNLQVLKLRRAVESMEDSDENEFWRAFAELIGKVEEPEETDLRSLSMMLGENDRAIREWMDLIRRTATALHKITDGESFHLEGEVGPSEELEELMEMADDVF